MNTLTQNTLTQNTHRPARLAPTLLAKLVDAAVAQAHADAVPWTPSHAQIALRLQPVVNVLLAFSRDDARDALAAPRPGTWDVHVLAEFKSASTFDDPAEPLPPFVPFPFDADADGALLVAAGYVHEFHPAEWYDDGGVENGPHLSGHPDLDVWTMATPQGHDHEIVVVDGMVVQAEYVPQGPEGWQDQF